MKESDKYIKNNEEEEALLIKGEKANTYREKERLLNVFESIKTKFRKKDNGTIKEVYLSYEENKILKNREIKIKNITKFTKFFYKSALILITSINLMGSFLLVSLKKSFRNLLVTSIKCKFEISCDKNEFEKQANFFEYFLDKLSKEPIDFNLIMFCNFIGISISNLLGFRITSLIFLFFNFLVLLFTYNINYSDFESNSCKYSYPKIILLIANWFLMEIFIGGSTLLVQERFIKYYSLFDSKFNQVEFIEKKDIYQNDRSKEKEEKQIELKDIDINKNKAENEQENIKEKVKEQKEKTKQKNFHSLLPFGLANIIAYLGKYQMTTAFMDLKENYSTTNNSIIYNTSEEYLKLNNYSDSNYTDIPDTNNIDINSYNYQLNYEIFLYIYLVYIDCILLSILLFTLLICCFFKRKKKKKKEKRKSRKRQYTTRNSRKNKFTTRKSRKRRYTRRKSRKRKL